MTAVRRPPLDYQSPGTEPEPLPRDEKFMRVFLIVLGLLVLLIVVSYAGLAIT